jgi:hypothetical protein
MNSPFRTEMAFIPHARFIARLSVMAMMMGFAAMPAFAGPPHGTQRQQNVEEAPLPVDEVALQGLLRELKGRFRTYATDHFLIITDARSGELTDFGQAAEATYRRAQELASRLAIPVRPLRFKLPLLVYGEWEDYISAARRAGLDADKGMPGFFDETRGLCVLFDYVSLPFLHDLEARIEAIKERLKSASEAGGGEQGSAKEDCDKRRAEMRQIEADLAACESAINQTVVRHEIAHQVIWSLGILRPGDDRLWLKEGLAMQFECGESFRDNRHRLADFCVDASQADLTHIRALVGDPRLLSPGADRLPEAYAAGGVLVHHLIERNPVMFARYMRAAPTTSAPADGPARIADFETAFGPLDEKFELEFHATVDALKRASLRSSGEDDLSRRQEREGKQP